MALYNQAPFPMGSASPKTLDLPPTDTVRGTLQEVLRDLTTLRSRLRGIAWTLAGGSEPCSPEVEPSPETVLQTAQFITYTVKDCYEAVSRIEMVL